MRKIFKNVLLKNGLKSKINQRKKYSPNNGIRIKTSMLRSDFWDYFDAYIVTKGNIIVNGKTFTANNIEEPNNAAANVTATNTANDNSFGEKNFF